jgi:DNA-directed RNA polymerase subunit RPC12/RpoP
MHSLGTTLIIECTSCGNLFLAADSQKTRTCPYCGKRVTVEKAKKVASAENAFKASQLLRNIKNKKGFSK